MRNYAISLDVSCTWFNKRQGLAPVLHTNGRLLKSEPAVDFYCLFVVL